MYKTGKGFASQALYVGAVSGDYTYGADIELSGGFIDRLDYISEGMNTLMEYTADPTLQYGAAPYCMTVLKRNAEGTITLRQNPDRIGRFIAYASGYEYTGSPLPLVDHHTHSIEPSDNLHTQLGVDIEDCTVTAPYFDDYFIRRGHLFIDKGVRVEIFRDCMVNSLALIVTPTLLTAEAGLISWGTRLDDGHNVGYWDTFPEGNICEIDSEDQADFRSNVTCNYTNFEDVVLNLRPFNAAVTEPDTDYNVRVSEVTFRIENNLSNTLRSSGSGVRIDEPTRTGPRVTTLTFTCPIFKENDAGLLTDFKQAYVSGTKYMGHLFLGTIRILLPHLRFTNCVNNVTGPDIISISYEMQAFREPLDPNDFEMFEYFRNTWGGVWTQTGYLKEFYIALTNHYPCNYLKRADW